MAPVYELNRYAQNAAFYLGHHWAYRKVAGEPQLVFNYIRTMSDFLTNFTFHKGIQFRSEPAYTHIVPALLERIWTVDNKSKQQLLWAIGQTGSIYGDCFVKVAYEPKWTDPTGLVHPGRVRILPINPSFCFP